MRVVIVAFQKTEEVEKLIKDFRRYQISFELGCYLQSQDPANFVRVFVFNGSELKYYAKGYHENMASDISRILKGEFLVK